MRNEIETLLHLLSPDQRERLDDWQRSEMRQGFAVTTKRTWDRGGLKRRFTRSRQPFSLSRVASKLGGVPYLTDPSEWPTVTGSHLSYIGQLNFAEMSPGIPPLVAAGVLVLYFDRDYWRGRPPLVCRWYPEPREEHAVDPPADIPPLVRLFEAQMRFRHTTWVPMPTPETARAILGPVDGVRLVAELKQPADDVLVEWATGIGREDDDAQHEVLPADLGALMESAGPSAFEGRVVVFRLDYDNEAGFGFGTNTFYLHIGEQDLRRGELDRITSAVANA